MTTVYQIFCTLKIYPHNYTCRAGLLSILRALREDIVEITRVGELEGGLGAIMLHIQINPLAEKPLIHSHVCLSSVCLPVIWLERTFISSRHFPIFHKLDSMWLDVLTWYLAQLAEEKAWGTAHHGPILILCFYLMGDTRGQKHPPISPCLPQTYSIHVKTNHKILSKSGTNDTSSLFLIVLLCKFFFFLSHLSHEKS